MYTIMSPLTEVQPIAYKFTPLSIYGRISPIGQDIKNICYASAPWWAIFIFIFNLNRSDSYLVNWMAWEPSNSILAQGVLPALCKWMGPSANHCCGQVAIAVAITVGQFQCFCDS